MTKPKRGDKFNLSWLKYVCIVTATRKGTLYFSSGEDRYQMPIETFLRRGALDAERPNLSNIGNTSGNIFPQRLSQNVVNRAER